MEHDALSPGCLDPVLKGCNTAASYEVDNTFTWELTFFGEKTHLDCGPRGLVLDTTAFCNVCIKVRVGVTLISLLTMCNLSWKGYSLMAVASFHHNSSHR